MTSLALAVEELDLTLTLGSGQAFLWQLTGEGEWAGPIGERLFTLRRTSRSEVEFNVSPPCEDGRDILEDYFRLKVDLSGLYRDWSERDSVFARRCGSVGGVRLLKQDPFEALVAFICSSNNNIKRITNLMNKLCAAFGTPLGCHRDKHFYSFPTLDSLVGCEERLKELGFGYRSKFISKTTKLISEQLGGLKWLHSLKDVSYREAWLSLQQLPGVGSKVADCVCLMGLCHLEAVPVDVHVFNMAATCYGTVQPTKSLTTHTYQIIGDHFRSLFLKNAGWAQAVLFASELKQPTRKRPYDDVTVTSSKRACDGVTVTSSKSTCDDVVITSSKRRKTSAKKKAKPPTKRTY